MKFKLCVNTKTIWENFSYSKRIFIKQFNLAKTHKHGDLKCGHFELYQILYHAY